MAVDIAKMLAAAVIEEGEMWAWGAGDKGPSSLDYPPSSTD
jgi:hypothetical protein